MVHNKPYGFRTLSTWLGAAVLAVGGLSSCNGYDLAEEDPSWLGASIYDYLQSEGTYTNTVRLINDLDYAEVLAKTGSKTLFVADDEAFARFFKNNSWGVRSYDGLTEAQKKLLLFGSMINNSCQVAYLSSSAGPTEGDCMRRLTATSEFDSVTVYTPAMMPDNPYWARYRDNNRSIVCMTDITAPPMIHFIEAFLTNKLITNDDCNFLFNHTTERQPGDANVNGIHMVEQNIKCSNGFVHKMADVITPLPNMAELINQKPNMKGWAKLLNRYCAPYYAGDDATREYNRLYQANIDSLFDKRFFSKHNRSGEVLETTPDEGPASGLLKFDPGWNQFSSVTNTADPNVALQENMGVMLVPSDAALDRYWKEGAGSALREYYGSWENVPDNVIEKMLNVNMLESFINSVPSKFSTVLNDANDELGLAEEFVDSVFMTCNGAIYLTNKVFNPVSYISVTFPALVDQTTMSILYWAVEQLGFDVYLNSQSTYYSLFIPRNNALLEYIDPCSFGKTETQLFRFRFDPSAQTRAEQVKASIWNYDTEAGVVTDSIREASYGEITDRLEDILDNHIVIGNVEDGNTFYQTKGGSMVKVANATQGAAGMTVQGGYQLENGTKLNITKVYDESVEGNCKTYIIDEAPILTARKSVFDILNEHEEYSGFRDLLQSSQFLTTKHAIGTDVHAAASTNISLFNTYRYTVYVPSNKAIADLQKAGKLPTWEMVAEEEDEEIRDSLTNEIENFIKYHIQDNAYYVGQGNVSGQFETSAYKITDGNLSYYKLNTRVSNDGIEITDGTGKTYHVNQKAGLYNQMAREYQYNSSDAAAATEIYTSSFAVVHLIDGALMYK